MTPRISARTRVVAVIGDPIEHSLSPLLHNAAFAATGLDWVYVAFPVAAGEAGSAIAAMQTLGIAGLNVTMPHKSDAAAACDVLTDDAAALRSVNTVVRQPAGPILGDSTDGPGFVRSLRDDGVNPDGCNVLVVGAGGAARAVILALSRGSGTSIGVWARRPAAASAAAAVAAGTARAVEDGELSLAVEGADIVVNATPLGMQGEAPPFPPSVLHAGQHVVDLVYHPAVTPLLEAAAAAGAAARNGLGMLVHQAALSFERWTGMEAPIAAMWSAARAAIDAPER